MGQHAAIARWAPTKAKDQCAQCLFRVGFGVKVIARRTGISPNRLIPMRNEMGVTPVRRLNAGKVSRGSPEWVAKQAAQKAAEAEQGAMREAFKAEWAGVVEDYYALAAQSDKKALLMRERSKRRYHDVIKQSPQLMAALKERAREWGNANKHLKPKKTLAYRIKNRDKWKKWQKAHRAKPKSRMVSNVRKRLKDFIKGKLGSLAHVGCTRKQLFTYIESRFTERMSWDNYGEWHIDHIRPLCSFDFNDRTQIPIANHFTNLQPLWAIDNIKKGGKIVKC